ncbi:MAG: type I restriction enzyme endonuclease domain-containing protein, partial [Deferrisomatales bacterium]
ATVPLYYDARGDKLGVAVGDLNERIAEKLEEIEIDDIDVAQRLEQELKRDYHIITADKRLDQVARDLVRHYSTAWETGKAMLVCIDKLTCVKMHGLIAQHWEARIAELEQELTAVQDEQEEIYRRRQLASMRETLAAVVVSEEQGEVEKFRKWGLDIIPHRRRIKEGFATEEGERIDLESAFKKDEHPFRIAIVCAMWLTGFDVPSLATLYLDKPLKAHTLMQAIARANRVNEGKNNGLIVDYCGVLKSLRKALATFAGRADGGHGGEGGDTENDPTRPEEELLEELAEAIALVRAFLTDRGASLDAVRQSTGFARNAAILAAKEAANENDETRKRFEVMCRAVFQKFKACLTLPGINAYRHDCDAINIVYQSLQQDRERADISDIIRQLHQVVDQAIETQPGRAAEDEIPWDISKIDFDRLRKEFERSPAKRTTVQNLREAVEVRLRRLLAQNPLRTDFQEHYEQIVKDYNQEKDRKTIEATFEALLKLVKGLDEEASRAVREGLDEESLAIFDLLKKPDLGAADLRRIKQVAVELLATLKAERLRIEHWRDRENTRDAVQTAILNFLYSDQTGLPVDSYDEEEVALKTSAVFRHVFRVYPTLPSPFYSQAA